MGGNGRCQGVQPPGLCPPGSRPGPCCQGGSRVQGQVVDGGPWLPSVQGPGRVSRLGGPLTSGPHLPWPGLHPLTVWGLVFLPPIFPVWFLPRLLSQQSQLPLCFSLIFFFSSSQLPPALPFRWLLPAQPPGASPLRIRSEVLLLVLVSGLQLQHDSLCLCDSLSVFPYLSLRFPVSPCLCLSISLCFCLSVCLGMHPSPPAAFVALRAPLCFVRVCLSASVAPLFSFCCRLYAASALSTSWSFRGFFSVVLTPASSSFRASWRAFRDGQQHP